jgi:hypothetical protein
LRSGVSLADTDYGTALLDENSGDYWTLNPTGALVLRTLLGGGTRQQAVQAVGTEYAVDQQTADRDVAELIDDLRAAGLVES